jgi:hypothetical protein
MAEVRNRGSEARRRIPAGVHAVRMAGTWDIIEYHRRCAGWRGAGIRGGYHEGTSYIAGRTFRYSARGAVGLGGMQRR